METVSTLRTSDGVTHTYRLSRASRSRGLIVLIHGLASNLTRWSEFIEHTPLKQDWDILRYDLRGHGESMTRGRIGMEQWCADLVAILAHEHYPKAYIVGNCLGANIALYFAVRHPGKIAGLVLVEPLLRTALSGKLRYLRVFTPLLRLFIGLIHLLNALGLYRRQLPVLDLRTLDTDTRAVVAASGDARDIARRYSMPWYDLRYLPTANYLQFLLEVVRPPPPLASIAVPTLTLISLGISFSEPEITKKLVSAIPHSQIVVIESHHWLITEKPEETRRAIERWFSNL